MRASVSSSKSSKSSQIRKKSSENVARVTKAVSTISSSSHILSNEVNTTAAVPETETIAPPVPSLPSLDFYSMSKEEVLLMIQQYISSFQYNYTSTMYFKLKKSGNSHHILEVFNLLTICFTNTMC
jgi:nucleoside-diphosphate-sugar epimerase